MKLKLKTDDYYALYASPTGHLIGYCKVLDFVDSGNYLGKNTWNV